MKPLNYSHYPTYARSSIEARQPPRLSFIINARQYTITMHHTYTCPRQKTMPFSPEGSPMNASRLNLDLEARNLVDRSFRLTYPLSILAHQLRRRFPPNNSLFRGAGSIYQTARPEGSLVFRPFRPGVWNRSPSKPKPSSVPRPFLGRPLLRPASLTFPTRRSGAASR
jgi:hypothetical protein